MNTLLTVVEGPLKPDLSLDEVRHAVESASNRVPKSHAPIVSDALPASPQGVNPADNMFVRENPW